MKNGELGMSRNAQTRVVLPPPLRARFLQACDTVALTPVPIPFASGYSASKQFDRHGWSGQQDDDQNLCEIGHGTFAPTGRLGFPNFLHEIAESDRRVLKTMSKVVDLRNRPSLSLVFAQID